MFSCTRPAIEEHEAMLQFIHLSVCPVR